MQTPDNVRKAVVYAVTNGRHETERRSAADILIDARQARYAAESRVEAMKEVVKVAEALALLQSRGLVTDATTVSDILTHLASVVS